MAAPKVDVRQDEDGGLSLVTEVGGVVVVFATVNPSALNEAAVAQGKASPVPEVKPDEGGEG